MIRKIIDMLSGAIIFSSAIAAIPIAASSQDGPLFRLWVLAVFLSGMWQLYTYKCDKEEEE
ncbi:MAG TPA: hypothetical protein DCR27_12715 [Lachnospiraceae bacterium]|nr:hypothetical protein [Lachnospiraceae bacterium]